MSDVENGSNNSGGNQAEAAHLILGRHEGQRLIIRPLGIASEFDIEIQIVEVRNARNRIGIRCLREITILRGELEDSGECKSSRLGKVVETLRRLLTGEISQLRAMRIANDLKLWSLPRVELEITNTDLME
jgi:sRNA-binding carbon storage regulator CsrA